MRTFLIERIIPGIGSAEPKELEAIVALSNAAVQELGHQIQWVHSYVAPDKMFCIYLANDEDLIRKDARITGFPADTITEITTIIDPTTATGGGPDQR